AGRDRAGASGRRTAAGRGRAGARGRRTAAGRGRGRTTATRDRSPATSRAPLMKSSGLLTVFAWLALAAGPEPIDTATSRSDDLLGTWRLMAYEYDGQKAPPEVLRG